MPANPGHILIPISPEARRMGEVAEYDAAKRVFRRPKPGDLSRQVIESVSQSARICKIVNMPVMTHQGVKTFNPLQAACMAFQIMQAKGREADVIRVVTPNQENVAGERIIADISFKCSELAKLARDDKGFFPDVDNGSITMEREAEGKMPTRWGISEQGILAPGI
jgi:hypothetical protein